MINKPLVEAERIYAQYDRELPFLRQLSDIYTGLAHRQGYITLYDGARRHFDRFAPPGKWSKGAGPCGLEEARERLRDPGHPWYRQQLKRVDVHTALNALIQGSAARHTKLWMRACWREGIVPLLQMHDCLDCSVSSREQAEMVAQLGCEAVQLLCADARGPEIWPHLGRCCTYVGRAQRRHAPHCCDRLGDLDCGTES
jgi:hypothetical protein